jgi:hypothetical protein
MSTIATPVGQPSRVKGTVSAADAISLTDESAKWSKNQFVGDKIKAISNGHETTASVFGNDGQTLEIDVWSDGVPDVGSSFEVIGNTVSWEITDHDIALAIILFYSEAPDHFRGIMDLTGGWKWDATTQQFVQPNGRPLASTDLRSLAILVALAIEDEMRQHAKRVATGDIPIDQFQDWQATKTKQVYLIMAILGAGGEENLTPEMVSVVSGKPTLPSGVTFSFVRLENFANDIASGEDGTVEAIQNRASAYAQSSLPMMETIRVVSHRNAKDDQGRPLFLFYRNILMPGDNCSDGEHTEGCIETTAAGWQPIGTLPEIGARTCKFNCRCAWNFSLTGME